MLLLISSLLMSMTVQGFAARNSIYFPYTFSESINPYRIVWSGDWAAARHTWLPLLDLDGTGKAYPLIAESWTSAPDGKSWTFHIRKNLKWSDGTPLTTTEIVESLERSRKGTSHSNLSKSILNIKTEKESVIFNLKRPVPQILIFLSYVDWAIVPSSAVAIIKGDPVIKSYHPYSGPYGISKVDSKYVTLTPNPYSSQKDKLTLPEYNLKIFRDCSELISKEVQILSARLYTDQATPKCLDFFKSKKYSIIRSSPTWIHNFTFTTIGEKHFSIRERQWLLTRLANHIASEKPQIGTGLATGPLANNFFGHLEHTEYLELIQQMSRDIKESDRPKTKMRIYVRSDWAKWTSYKWIVDLMKRLETPLEETILNETEYNALIKSKQIQKKADLMFSPIGVGDPDPDGAWRFTNSLNLDNRVSEQKLDEACIELNEKARSEKYKNLARDILKRGLFIPLFVDSDYIFIHPDYDVDQTISFGTGMFLYELIRKHK